MRLSHWEREHATEAAIIAASLQQFARIFGPEAERPRATLYKDWAAGPLTATSKDWDSVDHPHGSGEGWTSGPWRERLTLAGSEVSPTEAGYLSGAVEASRLAVEAVISRLTDEEK